MTSAQSVVGDLRGCLAQPLFQQVDTVRGTPPQTSSDILGRLFSGLSRDSGQSREFDTALGVLLTEMSGRFRSSPGFGFFDDGNDPNAFALPDAWIQNTDGTIGLGRSLVRQHLTLDENGASIAAICAHEFAHIYQYRTPYFDTITKSSLPPQSIELHADYLAGAFLRSLKYWRPDFSFPDVQQSWGAMRTSSFSNKNTHGRPMERLAAINQGFFDAAGDSGFSSIASHAASGLSYLRSRFS